MVDIAKKIIMFAVVFVIVYLLYTIFNVRNMKKYNRKKTPVNVKYLIYKYKLDIVRIGYKRVFKTLTICDSLIVATLFTVTSFIDNTLIRMLVAFILVFPLFAGVYHLVAKYYKKESD